MRHVTLSIYFEESVAEELRQVAGKGSVSAFVNEAVRQRLQAIRLRGMLDEMEVEVGPIPEDVQRAVDALPWPDERTMPKP